MEKAPKKLNDLASRRERRKKFGNWVSIDQYYKSQGKSRPIYTPSSSNLKRKKPTCTICWEKVGNATLKADNCWYCNECEKYFGMRNKERREASLPQNKNKDDYKKVYEFKLWLLYQIKNLRKFSIKKWWKELLASDWIQLLARAGAVRYLRKRK